MVQSATKYDGVGIFFEEAVAVIWLLVEKVIQLLRQTIFLPESEIKTVY